MNRKRTDTSMLVTSVGAFCLMSASFLLMPVEKLSVLAGGCFWAGLLAGMTLQVLLEVRRRNFFKEHRANWRKMQRPRNGLLTFGANPLAKVADVLLIISFIGLVASLWLTRGTGYLCYIMISVTVFSFCMHCVLNGRNYFHIKNREIIRRVLEKKKDRTFRKERDHE